MSSSTDILLHDKEETDQIERSNKKVKTGNQDGISTCDYQAVDEFMESRHDSTRKKTSYRDMVVDGVEEKYRLQNKWSKSLIVKLLGHTLGYNFLVHRLKTLRLITSVIDVIDVGYDTYVVRFASMDEYECALFDGPWVIADHYLAVSRWYHNFDPETFSISKLAVWVRFLNLPIEYYDQEFLLKIGCRIGNPLRVDMTTITAVRGRFARLCVEIDLSKLLLTKFRVRRRVRRIEFEVIHVICLQCEMYGHRKEECIMHGDRPEGCLKVTEAPVVDERNFPESEVTEAYGKWMLVRKQSKKKGKVVERGVEGVTKFPADGQGSRFSILNELFGDLEEENPRVMKSPNGVIDSRVLRGNFHMKSEGTMVFRKSSTGRKNSQEVGTLKGNKGKEVMRVNDTPKTFLRKDNDLASIILGVTKDPISKGMGHMWQLLWITTS
ncbi:hypothetical protein PTKIN_Ptkin17bG0047600 [Pterospermum kingtungense]